MQSGQPSAGSYDSTLCINIDIIFKLIGIEPLIRKRAVRVANGNTVFLVMNPLDVLHNRLVNLHQLSDKKNTPDKEAKCPMGLAMAINVGREFLRAEAQRLTATESDTAFGRSSILS